MGPIRWIKSKFGGGNKESQPLVSLPGREARRKPLPTQHISYMFCPLSQLVSIDNLRMFSDELNVSTKSIRKDINRVVEGMKDNLQCVIEYPYIDEFYRDTYYSFYSRKHNNHARYCFRISVFDSGVNEENFYDDDVSDKYFGFFVLRPTPQRVIGYTFLTPTVYVRHNISTCMCERTSSIMGRMFRHVGFPFCGQDGDLCTCAETSIMVTLDYLSRKYNRYQRILPSEIANMNLPSFRLQPSIGIDLEDIVSSCNNIGLTTRRYQKTCEGFPVDNTIVYSDERFKRLLHIYVESGFPLLASTGTHTFIIIGREDKLFSNSPRLVIADDNKRPYAFLDNEDDIKFFVVPQSDNILLDANKLDVNRVLQDFQEEYRKVEFHINDTDYYHRIFLTTSRSFKRYIIGTQLAREDKTLIVSIAMPRFIWVAESIKMPNISDDISQIRVSVTTVFDATEYAKGHSHLLMVRGVGKLIIPTDDEVRPSHRVFEIYDSVGNIPPFNNNLKGQHNQWQS